MYPRDSVSYYDHARWDYTPLPRPRRRPPSAFRHVYGGRVLSVRTTSLCAVVYRTASLYFYRSLYVPACTTSLDTWTRSRTSRGPRPTIRPQPRLDARTCTPISDRTATRPARSRSKRYCVHGTPLSARACFRGWLGCLSHRCKSAWAEPLQRAPQSARGFQRPQIAGALR